MKNCKACKHYDTQDSISGDKYYHRESGRMVTQKAGWCRRVSPSPAVLSTDGCFKWEESEL